MSARLLPRRTLPDLARHSRDVVPRDAILAATAAIDAVRARGEAALREYAERFGDIRPGAPLVVDRAALARALDGVPTGDRVRLEGMAARIRRFAEAQRQALADVTIPLPGGAAGHWIAPVERAGCYAPGGRYPLPSSLLMTAVVARVAGVREVWVASPNPPPIMLAAAAVAGADGLLCAGGAHAIAALACGAGAIPPCGAVVGPGNRYVTAAKQLVAACVAIDTLAGPSELLVLADAAADPDHVAAELLAQAEHDPNARPMLVTTDAMLAERVDDALDRQLAGLPTAGVARASLANGGVIVVDSLDDAVTVCDAIAPEHLLLDLQDADAMAPRLIHYGALFIGSNSSVVLGDYGAGPNHVLPTGGTARSAGGLSVYTFWRVRTWLKVDDPVAARSLLGDAVWCARVEGLEAHARAAERLRDRCVAAPVTPASAG